MGYQSKEKLKEILKEYGFNRVGVITKEDYVYEGRGRKPKDTSRKQLKFTPEDELSEFYCSQKGVYITVDDNDQKDFYIGSAMNGWLERFKQYKSGLWNESAGSTNVDSANRILGIKKLFVYYIIPECHVLPTGERIDMTQSFENFLINKYEPHYNTATKR